MMSSKQVLKLSLLLAIFISCRGSSLPLVKHHEILHAADLSHTIVKRGINSSPHPFNKIKEVAFKTLGREFRLVLTLRKHLLHSQFKAYEVDANGSEKIHHMDPDDSGMYEGRVYGEVQSDASVQLSDGVMTAVVRTKDDTYHIEPAWRHMDDPERRRMIAYRGSDVEEPEQPEGLGSHCAYVRQDGNATGPEWEDDEDGPHVRSKRQTTEKYAFDNMKTRCPLLLVADYRFYKDMGGSDTKTTINYLISLIDRVDKIYRETLWAERAGDNDLAAMGFVIKKIVVHNEHSDMPRGQEHYNMDTGSWDVRHLLEVFSREYAHKDFCLAHLFTDIRFDGGILGLAYVGSPRRNSVGGICTPEYFKNGFTLYLNSGLSSSRNHYGQRVITREADLVTAHEFGHNWGSEHDPDLPECSPSASKGGSYLMYTYSVSGYDLNNKRFSPCSLRSIRAVLRAKSSRCFTEPEESFCGNLRVEGKEECDAGLVGSENEDMCCDKNCLLRRPSHDGASLSGTSRAVCSDKNSPCCNNCHFLQMGAKCRQASLHTCEKEAKCNGLSAECPPSAPMSDDTECQEHGGRCRKGKCVPYCELRDLHSCMCDVEQFACRLCCRKSLNDTCQAVEPLRTLSGGTPCMHGFCTNTGVCEKTVQDVVERFWDIIEDININKVLRFLRDNIVGTVLVISIIIWIPASCVFSYVDAKRRRKEDEELEWQRRDTLVRPGERRVVYTRRRLADRDREHPTSGRI